MIVATGAAGFIGSHLVHRLNGEGRADLILVDDFSADAKKSNWQSAKYLERIQRNKFLDWLYHNPEDVEFVFHLGARTDTTETNPSVHARLNTDYSKGLWIICSKFQIPMVYASSAAVYGGGEHGYDDSDELTAQLRPLNEYGWSKLQFDQWVLQKREDEAVHPGSIPPFWAGLRFFNVYGSHEQHKGRMASVVHHATNQINETGKLKLFRSHRDSFADGEQKRDFILVDDVVEVCLHFLNNRSAPGIYNVGTGVAHTFNELGAAVFDALEKESRIEFIDTPLDIRDNYQYFTEAEVEKLRATGFQKAFVQLNEGVARTLIHSASAPP